MQLAIEAITGLIAISELVISGSDIGAFPVSLRGRCCFPDRIGLDTTDRSMVASDRVDKTICALTEGDW